MSVIGISLKNLFKSYQYGTISHGPLNIDLQSCDARICAGGITTMNTPNIQEFIKKNSVLFWWTPNAEKVHISENVLVERILNYGDEQNVKQLFDLIGIEEAAKIFYQQTSGPRCNYFPQVVNFFNLYFQRHVQRNPYKRAA